MARDTKREREPAESTPQPERPVAEREPLTITVIEPAAPQTAAPAPPVTIAPEPSARRIPLPRWYWYLVALAAAFVYMDYHYVWAARVQKFLEHRVLPPQVVRIEHSIWRHTFGEPKE